MQRDGERGPGGLPGPGRVKSVCSQELHAELRPCQTAYIFVFFYSTSQN
jgi:hypothetical protein